MNDDRHEINHIRSIKENDSILAVDVCIHPLDQSNLTENYEMALQYLEVQPIKNRPEYNGLYSSKIRKRTFDFHTFVQMPLQQCSFF